MNRVRCIKAALLLIGAVTLFGCKSKEEPTSANPPAPATAPVQGAAAPKSISGLNAAGPSALLPEDKADAEAAAVRVIAQMEAGDFSALYKEAAASFRQIGTEPQFVAKFQQTRQKTGPLANPKEIKAGVGPDRTTMLLYRLENDRFVSDRRITFGRNKEGKMELFGLNQHDEPKQAKPQAKK